MTESRQVHAVARRYLAPFGRYERVDNRLGVGWPDAYYLLRGVSGWIEEKILPPSGNPPGHLTLEQIRWGLAETAAGGRWYLLGRRGAEWRLYSAAGAAAWHGGGPDGALLSVTGRFPLREVLDEIAPLSAGVQARLRKVIG
jgi:hypothetical protein